MSFDLLGYNADFQKGNITLKLHQKKLKKIPDINNIGDVLNNSINQLIDMKIDDKIQNLPVNIKSIIDDVINSGNVNTEPIIYDIAKELHEDIKDDFSKLSENELKFIMDSTIEKVKNNPKLVPGTKGFNGVRSIIYSIVMNLDSLKDLKGSEKNNLATQLFNHFKNNIYK
jgi:hypothetical protein